MIGRVDSVSDTARAGARDLCSNWTPKHKAVATMLVLACIGGIVFFSVCFCQAAVISVGVVTCVVAAVVGVVNAERGPASKAHAALAAILGVGCLTIGAFLIAYEYLGSALSWAVYIMQITGAFMMGVTMIYNRWQKRKYTWGDWTSHYERLFFLAFAALVAGTPAGTLQNC